MRARANISFLLLFVSRVIIIPILASDIHCPCAVPLVPCALLPLALLLVVLFAISCTKTSGKQHLP